MLLHCRKRFIFDQGNKLLRPDSLTEESEEKIKQKVAKGSDEGSVGRVDPRL
jgi:hypothetical protein